MLTKVKTPGEILAMRESGRMLASVLNYLKSEATAGMNTKELADTAAKELKKLGGEPAFLGYQGFPDVLCTSVNDEVVHGIPAQTKILKSGDILSLDFGVRYKGMITDAALSVIIDKPLKQSHSELLKITEQALYGGIEAAQAGKRTGDIGAAVEAKLSKAKFGIVRDLVGHGVGHQLHEEPNVPNYGRIHTGSKLLRYMTIAVEPMATLGDERVYVDSDGWTVKTWDGSWAAHFEHTVLIDDNGAEILTSI